MRAIQNIDGHVGLTAREYPIATNTAVQRGQLLCLSGGLVATAAAAQTTAILGVAAEDHPGTADALAPRANGPTILVYDSPALVFECPAPEIAVASGSATTVVSSAAYIDADIADDAFNGGCLRLKSKAANSGNTDPVGGVRRVSDYAKATFTFTLPSGGTPGAGDVYQVFPPIGFNALALDSDRVKGVITDTGATAVRVVGADMDRGMLRCMAALHTLATEN